MDVEERAFMSGANPPMKGSAAAGTGGGGGGPCGCGCGMPVTGGFRREVTLRRVTLSVGGKVSRGFECSDLAEAAEAAVSRRDARDARLSGRLVEDSEVDDRCFVSETTCRYIDCLPRRPCKSFVIIFLTSGR